MALGSTQPPTEMSTGSISWGKGVRCVRWTTLPPSCTVVMKSGNLNFLEPSGPLQACNGTALPFYLLNPLTSNDPYSGRTAPLNSKRCILYIYSTNIGTEYFKHDIYSPFFLFKMQFVS